MLSPRTTLEERQQINTFIVPDSNIGAVAKDYSKNQVYEQGSNLTLAWDSNYTTIVCDFTQDLLCVPGVTPCGITSLLFQSAIDPSTYIWTVDPTPYNITASNVFYFVMYNMSKSDTSATFTSHYFNISTKGDSVSNPTSTSSTTSLPASTMSSSPSSSVTAPPSSSGLSSGMKAGIGLGVAALVVLTFIAAMLWLRYQNRPKTHDGSISWSSSRQELESKSIRSFQELEDRQRMGKHLRGSVHEAPAQAVRFELDGIDRSLR